MRLAGDPPGHALLESVLRQSQQPLCNDVLLDIWRTPADPHLGPAECLAAEASAFDVRVALIEPGLVGRDAETIVEHCARMTDEEFVAMGRCASDEEFFASFERHFGIDVRRTDN